MRIPLPALNASMGRGHYDRAQPEVKFYFDFVCPYAYLASLQLPALCERMDAFIEYRPILLGGVLKALGSEPNAGPQVKTAMTRRDLQRWAEYLQVPLSMPAEHPRRTVEALRLLCWAPRAAWPDLVKVLYRAYWVEGLDITSHQVLAQLAASVGLPAEAALLGLQRADVAAELRRRTDEAIQAGVFGVPTFVVDSHTGPRLFFGQDRLHFVEAALRHHPLRMEDEEVQDAPQPALSIREAVLTRSFPIANQARRLQFFYDVASPFAYLASTQIEQLAEHCGAVVDWHPILLGGLFRSLGTPMVPLSAYSPSKRRHTLEDLARWAHHYDQPFHFPTQFPMMTVTAQRLLMLAGERTPQLSHALFRAYWVADADLNDPSILEAALREAGLPIELLSRTSEPEVKERLQENTLAAERAGVFGVPSFRIPQPHGEPLLFFGQDRMKLVERALRKGTRSE